MKLCNIQKIFVLKSRVGIFQGENSTGRNLNLIDGNFPGGSFPDNKEPKRTGTKLKQELFKCIFDIPLLINLLFL